MSRMPLDGCPADKKMPQLSYAAAHAKAEHSLFATFLGMPEQIAT